MDTFNDKSINLKNIQLDKQNPRFSFSDFKTEEDIISYLFKYESLQTLVDSIIANDYVELGERIIVVKESDNYTVLEGNRRIAALKSIFLGKHEFNQAQRRIINRVVDEAPKNILLKCDVVSDRDDALYKIATKHISGIQTWNPYSKRAFYHNTFQNAVNHGNMTPTDALKFVAEQSPEGTAKIRNSIIANNFLTDVYRETKSKNSSFELRELPQLESEVIVGRVFSQIKKVFNLKVNDQYEIMDPNPGTNEYHESLNIIGRLAWIEKSNDNSNYKLNTRTVNDVAKWKNFLDNDGFELKRVLDAYLSIEVKPQINHKDESAASAMHGEPGDITQNTDNSSDPEHAYQANGVNNTSKQKESSTLKPIKYKLIVEENIVSVNKLPIDLVSEAYICIYDDHSRKINIKSSAYKKIILTSSPSNASILFDGTMICKGTSDGSYNVNVALGENTRKIKVEVHTNKRLLSVVPNSIYDDEWFHDIRAKIGDNARLKKVKNMLNVVYANRVISDANVFVTDAALLRPLIEICSKIILTSGSHTTQAANLTNRINMAKQKLEKHGIFSKEQVKTLSKIDEDLNVLNAFLHDPEGEMTDLNLTKMYDKYKLLFNGTVNFLNSEGQ